MLLNHQVDFVTRLKSNQYVTYKGKRIKAEKLGRQLLAMKRRYRFRQLGNMWARRTTVYLGEQGPFCFVVAKEDLDEEGTSLKFLPASNPRWGARQVVQRYRSHWIIEVFFRDLKQHLDAEAYQGRSLIEHQHHLLMCFAALVMLDSLRCGTNYTLEETAVILQRLLLLRDHRGQLQVATVEPAPPKLTFDLQQISEVVYDQFEKVLPLHLPKNIIINRDAA